jgi:hypothetical protein
MVRLEGLDGVSGEDAKRAVGPVFSEIIAQSDEHGLKLFGGHSILL